MREDARIYSGVNYGVSAPMANANCSVGSWYIPKKYTNFKEEILNNKMSPLSLTQYGCLMDKAIVHIETNTMKGTLPTKGYLPLICKVIATMLPNITFILHKTRRMDIFDSFDVWWGHQCVVYNSLLGFLWKRGGDTVLQLSGIIMDAAFIQKHAERIEESIHWFGQSLSVHGWRTERVFIPNVWETSGIE